MTSPAKKQVETVEPEPTAMALASRVAGLLGKKADLEKDLAETKEALLQIEKDRFSDSPVNEKSYRSARDKRGDLETRLEALDLLISELTDQGCHVLAGEIQADQLAMDTERVRLIQERQKEIEKNLVPSFAKFLIERERLTGGAFNVYDNNYMRGLHGLNFGQEEKKAMLDLIAKAGKPENPIGEKILAVERDLARSIGGKVPTFDELVDRAANEQ